MKGATKSKVKLLAIGAAVGALIVYLKIPAVVRSMMGPEERE